MQDYCINTALSTTEQLFAAGLVGSVELVPEAGLLGSEKQVIITKIASFREQFIVEAFSGSTQTLLNKH